jgi:hypothetical protein
VRERQQEGSGGLVRGGEREREDSDGKRERERAAIEGEIGQGIWWQMMIGEGGRKCAECVLGDGRSGAVKAMAQAGCEKQA